MLTDITLGQYYPGESYIHKLDPRTKILATLIFISSIFLASTYTAYIVLTVFVALVVGVSRLPVKLVIQSIKPLWVIILLTFCIHIFSTPGETLYSWRFIKITDMGVQQGVLMSLRLAFLIVVSSLLTFTTSPIVLTDGIESLLNPFRRIGVPAHELAMMMTIALRFIPTLLEETDRIMKAQIARGADFQSGNLLKRAKNLLPLLVPLFISAFRRADDLAIAMEARCYRGGENRTRMHQLAFAFRDGTAIAAVLLLTLALVWVRWRGL